MEFFEVEMFICIKMDLRFVTYNGRCAINPNQTKSCDIWQDA